MQLVAMDFPPQPPLRRQHVVSTQSIKQHWLVLHELAARIGAGSPPPGPISSPAHP